LACTPILLNIIIGPPPNAAIFLPLGAVCCRRIGHRPLHKARQTPENFTPAAFIPNSHDYTA